MDKLESDFTYSSVLYPIALFIGAQIMLDVVWRLSDWARMSSEPYVRRSILLDSYNYTQHHSYSFFQNRSTGTISSKIKDIVNGFEKFWAEIHFGSAPKILKITINLIALFFVNLYIGSFLLVWCLIYFPVYYKLSVKLKDLAFLEKESQHALLGQVADKVSNVISIFAFSARKRELNSLKQQINKEVIPKELRTYRFNFYMQILGGFLYLIMFVFILFLTLNLKSSGLITTGDFAFIFGLTLVVAEDIWHVTNSLQDFSKTLGKLKSALSLINKPHEHVDSKKAKALELESSAIQLKEVCFSYNNQKPYTLSQFSLHIKAGEKIGLVGPSGAGKSSLINLLLKYFPHKQGEVLVGGHKIDLLQQDYLREKIAVIPQDTALFHRNIIENIRFARINASDEEVIAACKKAHIHDYIMSLPKQYQTYVGERGVKLSGGQRQRIAIARAILKDAPILILDEATSALDSHTEKLIQDSLNFFIENAGKTVIAIAHRLSTLKHMDRILVMSKGQIVERGTHDSLLKTKTAYIASYGNCKT